MYVYLDETTFGPNNEFSGYASLATKDPINETVIIEALEELKKDKDITRDDCKYQDTRTLERQFFHATDDSRNSHSHLCRSIKRNIIGNFKSHHFRTHINGFNNLKDAYMLASQLAITSVFQECEEVTFIFEERNDLTPTVIKKWWENLWPQLMATQFKFPFIRMYYPDLKFDIRSKSEPGLQVVDFILWASTRQITSPNCQWLSRLEPAFRSDVTAQSGSWGGHCLCLGNQRPALHTIYGPSDYKNNDINLNSFEYLTHYIVNAQNIITALANHPPPKATSHFWQDIIFLNETREKQSDADHIKKLAICFLKIFDNLPVITIKTNPDDKAFWLSCRKCFAMALLDNIDGIIHAHRLAETRNQIIKNSKRRLG